MGWWPWPFGGKSAASEATPPTRQERQACWDARDAYFVCLDSVGVVRPGSEGHKVCAVENRLYEKTCAQSWVTYFNERRRLAFAQKDMIAQANAQNAAAAVGKR
ncbi:cytochrome oxidase c subunit VIb-domain-containing protein [Mycena amicta]|nr:cytochrome oxidase c subunit VIb-domain-containing protein [Mycena amicta]